MRVVSRIAILGFGSSGRRFSQIISDSEPESQVLVYSSQDLSDTSLTQTRDLAAVGSFRPEIALICGPASHRVEMVEALPPKMSGIFIEKPLALSVEDGLLVNEAVLRRGAVSHVGYNLRFSSSLAFFRARVRAGDCGIVLSVRAETGQYLPDWRPKRDYRSTVSAQRALGGGVLNELSHEIDYLNWIFGPMSWVSGWTGKQSELEIDVEDCAHLTLGFAGFGNQPTFVGQLDLDLFRHNPTRTVTALGEKGTLRWDGISGLVEWWGQGSDRWVSVFAETLDATSTYKEMWHSFRNSISSENVHTDGLESALLVLRLIEAARESDSSNGIRQTITSVGHQK